jgi:hypothetical protein
MLTRPYLNKIEQARKRHVEGQVSGSQRDGTTDAARPVMAGRLRAGNDH